MTDYSTAIAKIETAVTRVTPHLKAEGGQVSSSAFAGGFAGVLLDLFIVALKGELARQAAKAGVDVVQWAVAKIRAYFKEQPKPAEPMRIMPHLPAGADAAGAEQVLRDALAEFVPADEAARLAKTVRSAVAA